MSLLGPSALWLLALLLPLVVLYILKVRRRRQRVGSTWLWQQARRDLMARSPFQRLLLQAPLVLQALALVLLALAAARPASSGKTLSGDHIAIIIDTSASMSTIEANGKTRLDLAKTAAHELVRALPPGSDALVLDAGRSAVVALPADRDKRRIHTAIAELEARQVEGKLEAGLALAVARLRQQSGRRRVFLLSDGYWAHPVNLKSPAVPVEYIRVGQPQDNAAIVRATVDLGLDPVLRKPQLRAFLVVANYGSKARELFVTMRQHNASDTLASRSDVVPANGKAVFELSFYPAGGDYGSGLKFELSPHDSMPVDDVAYGRVPFGPKLDVVLAANKPDSWLQQARGKARSCKATSGPREAAVQE